MTEVAVTREIKALTGLRAFAALWVVLHHYGPYLREAWPWLDFAGNFIVTGIIGVDLFFVLSGFIISYTYESRRIGGHARDYLRFLWARLSRLYPVHLATLLIVFLLYRKFGAEPGVIDYSMTSFYKNLLLVHAWQYPLSMSWNFASWSVSTEWAAYVLTPAFFWIAGRLSPPPLAIAGIVVSGLGLIALYLSEIPGIQRYGLFALPRLLAGFLSGCLLHQLYQQRFGAQAPWARINLLCVVAIVLYASVPIAANKMIFAPWLFAALIYSTVWQQGPLTAFLSRPVMRYLGQVSYSLYLVHSVIWWFWKEQQVPVGLAESMLLLAVTAVAAIAMYHAVEVPARRWMRRAGKLEIPWTEVRPGS